MQQASSANAKLTGKTRSRSSLPDRSEYEHQVAIFAWAEIAKRELPELEMLIGSLNGVRLPIGSAVKAKRAGLKRGYPDIALDVPRSRNLGRDSSFWHGLRIELKTKTGRISPEQATWIANLQRSGYRAVVCRSSDEAIREITSYLKGLYS
jgi:VRR-NUC domain